eukprot:m.269876 g.269876  ORF g.269876 m.269876 type:complete len:316 (-) comp15675_c0_seq6:131-1078(-)
MTKEGYLDFANIAITAAVEALCSGARYTGSWFKMMNPSSFALATLVVVAVLSCCATAQDVTVQIPTERFFRISLPAVLGLNSSHTHVRSLREIGYPQAPAWIELERNFVLGQAPREPYDISLDVVVVTDTDDVQQMTLLLKVVGAPTGQIQQTATLQITNINETQLVFNDLPFVTLQALLSQASSQHPSQTVGSIVLLYVFEGPEERRNRAPNTFTPPQPLPNAHINSTAQVLVGTTLELSDLCATLFEPATGILADTTLTFNSTFSLTMQHWSLPHVSLFCSLFFFLFFFECALRTCCDRICSEVACFLCSGAV